jgi:D-tyrosyl-tRNA(Tyr) deacylase
VAAIAARSERSALKTVVQRVVRAEVHVAGTVIARIGQGAVVLVGVEHGDSEADADAVARKIAALRMFPGQKPMDLSLGDVRGACLVVSQFTLAASLVKGNRPSFERAEGPSRAEPLYLRLADQLRKTGLTVEMGRFGAEMQVELVNDGPVTFLVFARNGRLDAEVDQRAGFRMNTDSPG